MTQRPSMLNHALTIVDAVHLYKQQLVLGIGPKIENRLSERFSIRLSIWNRFFCTNSIKTNPGKAQDYFVKKISWNGGLMNLWTLFLALGCSTGLIWWFQSIQLVFPSPIWVVILFWGPNSTKDMTKTKIEKNRFWKRHNRFWSVFFLIADIGDKSTNRGSTIGH